MKNRNWFWGIIFILSAAVVVIMQVGSFIEIGVLSIIATVFLLAIFVQSIIRLNFFGTFVPLAFLYTIYQKPLGLTEISIWLLILAAVLLSIGFHIIFGKRQKTNCCSTTSEFNNHTTIEEIDNNNPNAKVSFGSTSKYLHSNNLTSGQFNVSFGELNVYFDQAQLNPDGADIKLDCSFGSINLFIPKSWRVQENISASLGEVENPVRNVKPDDSAPLLKLTGSVQLGSIAIQYI